MAGYLLLFAVALGWMPRTRNTGAAAPAPASRPSLATQPAHPPASASLPQRLVQRFLSGDDSWRPMRLALTQLREHPSELVYNKLFFEGGVKFQYPPSSLLVLEALQRGAGPRAIGDAALNAISGGFLLITLLLVQRLWIGGVRQALPAEVRLSWMDQLLPVVMCLAFFPLIRSLSLGQIQTWINCLLVGALLAWACDRRIVAGVLCGLVCTIKPQMVLLLPWAMLRRQWGFTLAMAIPMALIYALSLVQFGLAQHLNYLHVLSFISHHGESFFANQSVNGLLLRALHLGNNTSWDPNAFAPYHPGVYFGTLAVSAALIGSALLLGRRRQGRFDFAIALLSFTIASPVAWEHHYGFLVGVFALAAVRALNAKSTGARDGVLLGVAWVLCGCFFRSTKVLAGGEWNFLQSHLLIGALLLLAWLWYRRTPADEAVNGATSASPALH